MTATSSALAFAHKTMSSRDEQQIRFLPAPSASQRGWQGIAQTEDGTIESLVISEKDAYLADSGQQMRVYEFESRLTDGRSLCSEATLGLVDGDWQVIFRGLDRACPTVARKQDTS